MKKISENSEIWVLLLIIFFIFVTLVIFYQNKLKDYYYDNNDEYLTLILKVDRIVNNNLIVIDGDYVDVNKNISESLKSNLYYVFKFKTNSKLVLKGDINSLFKDYEIKEIRYGIEKS